MMQGIDLTYTQFPYGNLLQIYWWVNFERLRFMTMCPQLQFWVLGFPARCPSPCHNRTQIHYLPIFLPSPLTSAPVLWHTQAGWNSSLQQRVSQRPPKRHHWGTGGCRHTTMTHIHWSMWTQTVKNAIRSEGEQTQQKTKSHFYVTFQHFISDTYKNKPNLQSCSWKWNCITCPFNDQDLNHLNCQMHFFISILYWKDELGQISWFSWYRSVFHHITLNS